MGGRLQGDFQKAQGVGKRRVGDHQIRPRTRRRRPFCYVVPLHVWRQRFQIKTAPRGLGVQGGGAAQATVSGSEVQKKRRPEAFPRIAHAGEVGHHVEGRGIEVSFSLHGRGAKCEHEKSLWVSILPFLISISFRLKGYASCWQRPSVSVWLRS